jgi:magnesium-transporting ATPase (P-type)
MHHFKKKKKKKTKANKTHDPSPSFLHFSIFIFFFSVSTTPPFYFPSYMQLSSRLLADPKFEHYYTFSNPPWWATLLFVYILSLCILHLYCSIEISLFWDLQALYMLSLRFWLGILVCKHDSDIGSIENRGILCRNFQ